MVCDHAGCMCISAHNQLCVNFDSQSHTSPVRVVVDLLLTQSVADGCKGSHLIYSMTSFTTNCQQIALV